MTEQECGVRSFGEGVVVGTDILNPEANPGKGIPELVYLVQLKSGGKVLAPAETVDTYIIGYMKELRSKR